MYDFPNKVITIVLIFVMLIIAPLMFAYANQAMVTQREALNQMQLFLNEVTDADVITQQDINSLYIGVNSSGGTFDVSVRRYIATPLPTTVGNSRLLYTNVPYIDSSGNPITLNKGDLIKVTLTEIGVSPEQQLMYNILGLSPDTRPISLVEAVQ